MKLTKKDELRHLAKPEVEHIANLARLGLTEKEKEKFQTQISSILEYVNKLQEVEVQGIEPTAHVTGLENVVREDEIKKCGKEIRGKVLDNVPEREGELVKVKAVFE